jgi:hypothetical protein
MKQVRLRLILWFDGVADLVVRNPRVVEVNAIIMKASAGSKYHKNQMKRNAELEAKIEQLLKMVRLSSLARALGMTS